MKTRGLYQKRLKKAKRIAYLLSYIPFVRMVALSGSMTSKDIKANSDIDFFLVAQTGHIWTARFLTVLLLKILGQYRSDEKTAGKICPNRFQTEDLLTIYPHNYYHAKEYSQIIPLFENEDIVQKYIKANQWILGYDLKFKMDNSKIKRYFLTEMFRKFGERILSGRFGNIMEMKLKDYQKNRILWDKRTYQNKARIIISDRVLCFHPKAR